MVIEYKGPLILSDPDGRQVRLTYAQLWIEHGYTEFVTGQGAVLREDGLRSWHGQGRVPGLVYRLLDLLGGEVSVILPDGRVGRAYVTGYSQDSAWVIEVQGIGPFPQ